jgi:hypothetical protein
VTRIFGDAPGRPRRADDETVEGTATEVRPRRGGRP